MNHVFVWTVKDIVGLTFLGLLALAFLLVLAVYVYEAAVRKVKSMMKKNK